MPDRDNINGQPPQLQHPQQHPMHPSHHRYYPKWNGVREWIPIILSVAIPLVGVFASLQVTDWRVSALESVTDAKELGATLQRIKELEKQIEELKDSLSKYATVSEVEALRKSNRRQWPFISQLCTKVGGCDFTSRDD